MKTVQLKIYQPYGGRGYCVDLFYRGRLITGFMSNDLVEARANALTYAKNRGFTHAEFRCEGLPLPVLPSITDES